MNDIEPRLEMLKTIYSSGQLETCPFCHKALELVGEYDQSWVIIHNNDCRFKIEVNKPE